MNGSYSQAVLDNDTWVFTNLQLNDSLELQSLRFSAQNCNVTIVSYQESGISTESVRLSYTVEGVGNQAVNLGLGPQAETFGSASWNVGVGSNHFESVGTDWKLLSDGTVVVSGSTGNVTVTHYFFVSSLAGSSNLPFYVQHSVGIAVAIIFIATVLMASLIKVRGIPRRVNKKELEKNH